MIECNLSGYVEEKGIQKGIQKEKQETVERMLRGGNLPYAEIAVYTGLDEASVRKIAEELSVPV